MLPVVLVILLVRAAGEAVDPNPFGFQEGSARTLSLDRRRLKCTEYRTQESCSEQALFWDEAAKWLQDTSYVERDAIPLLPTHWIEGRSLRAGTLSSISSQLSQPSPPAPSGHRLGAAATFAIVGSG